jgi:hypothetical protein
MDGLDFEKVFPDRQSFIISLFASAMYQRSANMIGH